MNILVYSSVNIDSFFEVDHIVTPGETIDSSSVRKSAGGKGANQAASLARAAGLDSKRKTSAKGTKIFFAGKASTDGEWILQKLQDFGVDTTFVAHSEHGTGQAIIQVDKNGQNSIILHGGGNSELTTSEIDEVFNHFCEDDMVVINAEVNNLDYIMNKAIEKKMRICVNPSPVTKDLLNLPLEKTSILVLNEVEGAALAHLPKDTSFLKILAVLNKKYPNTEIVLTIGKLGAYYSFRGIVEHSPIHPTTAVDTTGAGDTFLGYFLIGRTSGKKVADALKNACRAASLSVSKKGAMDSIPTAAEVAAIKDLK